MARFYRKVSRKAGSSPGTLVERQVSTIKITLFDYDKDRYQEKELKTVEEAFPFKDLPTVTWLDIDGLSQPGILEKLGNHFQIHPLVLEDIQNTHQRPKLENYDGYSYIVLKSLSHKEDGSIHEEQLSVILGSNFVLTFTELPIPEFDFIRQRIRTNDSRLRKNGADYLAYRLLDTVVDNYFIVLEKVGERIEDLEEELMDNPLQRTLEAIYSTKREMLYMRKLIWPLREVVNSLTRGETQLIKKSTEVFLRDVYDHMIQVIDTLENFREIVSGMLDTYLSLASNRMNEVMKVLTIMATIFIPLTFVAGIYGMNFEFMPELKWRWGYVVVWGVMLAMATAMIFYFKRKKWL